MGQNQSAEKPTPSRGGSGHNDKADRDRKIHRRISVQALQRSQPADASASNIAVQGNPAPSSHNLDMTNLEKILQSNSPELLAKQPRLDRTASKAAKQKKETEANPVTQSTPSPAQGAPPAIPGSIDIPSNSIPISRARPEETEEDRRPAYEERHFVPISHHRPPRLPLPIAEVQTPDSPSLLPVDKGDDDVPIFHHDPNDTTLPRRNSMLSVATQEEEEDVGEELQPYGVGFTGETVPTAIEWRGPAERVFVTGTFAAWDRKYRLKKSESTGHFKVVLGLCPGTHHLKFFVDNNMITSPDLPTAVDFNNILVNYIEILHDDIPKQRRESGQIPSKQPPYQAQQMDELLGEDREQYSGTVTPGPNDSSLSHSSSASEIPIEEMPEGDFRQVTPKALLDIDIPEDDPRYKQAAQVISDGAAPPSLPLFLSRSILNGNLPVKDDSSVLALPNHTVLNHLMTSNVRNGVLATSVTTRYKKKYVTTISFKPVPKAKEQGASS